MKIIELTKDGLLTIEWDNPEEEETFLKLCKKEKCSMEELFNKILKENIKNTREHYEKEQKILQGKEIKKESKKIK